MLLWGIAAARHGLLQSNAYDLGLFDQWVWLIIRSLPMSSMEQVHVLADHGAWLLYGPGCLSERCPSIQWLLARQALALSLHRMPLWGWRVRPVWANGAAGWPADSGGCNPWCSTRCCSISTRRPG